MYIFMLKKKTLQFFNFIMCRLFWLAQQSISSAAPFLKNNISSKFYNVLFMTASKINMFTKLHLGPNLIFSKFPSWVGIFLFFYEGLRFPVWGAILQIYKKI